MAQLHDAYPEQLPKRTVFISYQSGHVDFAEQLCKDLQACHYTPFLDKREQSWPKGEEFPPLILKAARECRLAIVLASHDYFSKSRWGLTELAEFVAAYKAEAEPKDKRILPVLLGTLTPDDLSKEKIATWSTNFWSPWIKDSKHITSETISEWEEAVHFLKRFNMIVQRSDSDVDVREIIKNNVWNLSPPDISPDLSDVQGKERLYKEIMAKFSSVDEEEWLRCKTGRILGVYGITGEGKTTLCRILTCYLRGQFCGKVCVVDLGKGNTNTLSLLKTVLKQLTGIDLDHLEKHIVTEEYAWKTLKRRIPEHPVFLALDNVIDTLDSVEVGKNFLYDLKYHRDSKLLVTAHSKALLEHLSLPATCRVSCPLVTKEEAVNIVLCHNGLQEADSLTNIQTTCLQKCVESCNSGGFHPMALKVLAAYLGPDPSSWNSSNISQIWTSYKKNRLFKLMETILSTLDNQTKDMFMDIALFSPESVNNVHDFCIWLKGTLPFRTNTTERVKKMLDCLKRSSLLDVREDESVHLHDLHHQLAKKMVSDEGDKPDPRFFYQNCGDFSVSENKLASTIERLFLSGVNSKSLAFEECSQLKILTLQNCGTLNETTLSSLKNLVSVDISACSLEKMDLTDVSHLRWLSLNSCKALAQFLAPGCTRLRYISISKCTKLERVGLEDCEVLESAYFLHNRSLRCVLLGGGKCMKHLGLWFCEELEYMQVGEPLCLSVFMKQGCPNKLLIDPKVSFEVNCLVVNFWHKVSEEVIRNLQASKFLQVLDLWDCSMCRLPDLTECSNLRELQLCRVDVLLDSNNPAMQHDYVEILRADAVGLTLPSSLKEITIRGCRNSVLKQVCLKIRGLSKLSILTLDEVRVSWDWERCRMSKGYFEQPYVEKPMGNTLREWLQLTVRKGAEDSTGDASEGFDEEKTNIELEILIMVIACIFHIAHWITKFPNHIHAEGRHAEGRPAKVADIIDYHRKKFNEGVHLENYEDVGDCWWTIHENMVDEIKQMHYSSPDYVVLETIDHFQTFCKFCTKWSPTVRHELEELTKKHLCGQLKLLSKLNTKEVDFSMYDPLEKIMQEMLFLGNIGQTSGMTWEQYARDGIILRDKWICDIESGIRKLMKRWHWSMSDADMNIEDADLDQFRREWLQFCKICLSIQVVSVVAKEVAGKKLPWFRIGELMRSVEKEMEKIISDAAKNLGEEDAIKELVRVWKVSQWFGNLAFTFTAKGVEEEIQIELFSEPDLVIQMIMQELNRQQARRKGWRQEQMLKDYVLLEGWRTEKWLAKYSEEFPEETAEQRQKKMNRNVNEETQPLLIVQKDREERTHHGSLYAIEDFIHSVRLVWLRHELGMMIISSMASSNGRLKLFNQAESTAISIRQKVEQLTGCQKLLHPSNNFEEAAFHDIHDQITAYSMIDRSKAPGRQSDPRKVHWVLRPVAREIKYVMVRRRVLDIFRVQLQRRGFKLTEKDRHFLDCFMDDRFDKDRRFSEVSLSLRIDFLRRCFEARSPGIPYELLKMACFTRLQIDGLPSQHGGWRKPPASRANEQNCNGSNGDTKWWTGAAFDFAEKWDDTNRGTFVLPKKQLSSQCEDQLSLLDKIFHRCMSLTSRISTLN